MRLKYLIYFEKKLFNDQPNRNYYQELKYVYNKPAVSRENFYCNLKIKNEI